MMAVKVTGQLSLADALVAGVGSGALDRISGLVDWGRFAAVLLAVRAEDRGPGRAAWPGLLLFRALVLQSLYGLSDRETEAALADRLSFRRFCGLGLEEGVPDHAVLCRFRTALVAAAAMDRLFGALDHQLSAAGVLVKRGTMLDATLIETTSARPRGGKLGPARPGRDTEAGFARRQGKAGSVFGYKAHVGVDEGSGLVRKVIVTAANVNDTVVADRLLCGDERQVWADAACHTHAREAALKARGVKPRLARRANKHHPLSSRLKQYNRLIARRRAAVETTFATWKRRMGLTEIRYVGLAKATAQIAMVALAFNLRRWATLTA